MTTIYNIGTTFDSTNKIIILRDAHVRIPPRFISENKHVFFLRHLDTFKIQKSNSKSKSLAKSKKKMRARVISQTPINIYEQRAPYIDGFGKT